MEQNKQFWLKIVFAGPGILSFITAVYSAFYISDIIGKIICFHMMSVSLLPTLLEFSPYFREYILGQCIEKIEAEVSKMGILIYLCVLSSIVGVGVLGRFSAAVNLIGAGVLMFYYFKYKLAEKLGVNFGAPKLEEL